MSTFPFSGLALLLLIGSSTAADSLMQAAVLHRASVVVKSVPRPVPRQDQILIRLTDAAVDPVDWQQANEKFKNGATASIQGVDGAGIVEFVGSGAGGTLKAGDAVMVWSPAGGTYAQYIALTSQNVALKPRALSLAQAAGAPQAGIAAWRALMEIGQLKVGQRVLIIGGAEGIGAAAIQIAKIQGARVIATSSAHNAEYVRSIGADQVVDNAAEHYEDRLRDVDLVVNTVDIDNAYRALSVIKHGGRLVSTTGLPAAAQCAFRAVVCTELTMGAMPVAAILKQLSVWADSGRYRVNVDRTYPLTEVVRAWEYSESGQTRGVSVIHIGD